MDLSPSRRRSDRNHATAHPGERDGLVDWCRSAQKGASRGQIDQCPESVGEKASSPHFTTCRAAAGIAIDEIDLPERVPRWSRASPMTNAGQAGTQPSASKVLHPVPSDCLLCSNRLMVEILDLLKVVQVSERLRPRWPQLPNHLGSFKDGLYINPPKRTSAVIALPTLGSRIPPDWLTFVAVGRFRAAFSLIEELARLLAPTALNLGTVPRLVPLSEAALQGMTWDTPVIRDLRGNGLLLYGRGIQA